MKRTLLILSLITLTATLTQAQYYTKTRIMFYGEGGLNLANFYQSAVTEKGLRLNSVFKPMLGVYVKAKYPTLVGFDAGVSVSQQGANTKDSISSVAIFGDSVLSKAILNYAYTYADALYFFELQGDKTIQAGVGLYAGYAINGDRVIGSDKQKLALDDWKRFDFGLQFKTAINFDEWITLGMQYRIGFLTTLSSIDRQSSPNNLRNSVFSITAALRLFEIKKK